MMISPKNPIHYRGLIETMIFLGYTVYDSDHPSDNWLTTKADYVAMKLSDASSTPLLGSQIAVAWNNYTKAQKRATQMVPRDVTLCRDWECPVRHYCARFLITKNVAIHNSDRLTIYSIVDSCRAEYTPEELKNGCPAFIDVRPALTFEL